MPFADGGEPYSLTIFRDQNKSEADCLWMLYKGEGPASTLQWSMVSDDPGLIHHLVCSQLSGFTRGKSEFDLEGLRRENQANREAQSMSQQMKLAREEQSQSQQIRSAAEAQQMAASQEAQSQSQQLRAVSQPVLNGVDQKESSATIPLVAPAGRDNRRSGDVPKSKSRAMLEGDLVNLQMPTLLQSIGMGKMTGRLEVEALADKAVIYFSEGVPLHCQLRDSEGETALVEVIGWDEGEFRFVTGTSQDRTTIRKRLDQLLMEGAALIDQGKFLKEIGISFDSYLVRNHPEITEKLFEEMVGRGAQIDLNLQKGLYQLIDNRTTLEDLLRKRPLPKPRWVPVIFNLITTGLISFSEKPVDWQAGEVEPAEVDWQAIRAFEKSISVPDTGFLTYPAFFFLLEREFARFARFQRPFSLIVFELELKEDDSEVDDESVLADPAILSQVSQRIEKIRRKTDIIGHFEPFGFAMLLTETQGDAARSFSARLAEIISSGPLTTRGLLCVRVGVRLGVSSAPDNAKDLGTLLAAARPYNPEKL